MAEESKFDTWASVTSTDTGIKTPKTKKKGVFSRLWDALFKVRGDDFEKRLEHISKEEAAVLSRLKRRSQGSQRITWHLIVLTVLSEGIAVAYALITRSSDLNWKIRALQVLPIFFVPVVALVAFSITRSVTRMCDQKDHKTLEKLRAERQAKIDELKERTNYYITQQLIHRYDSDPAAKAAAASVLACKLGADTGLKVYVEENPILNSPTAVNNDSGIASSTGLRNRKQLLTKTNSMETGSPHWHEEGMFRHVADLDGGANLSQHHLVCDHCPQPGLNSNNGGGWIARLAALLVGEDPTQSYALICGSCHMHNGLVRKEDFPYVTYYCPHCKSLNRPGHPTDRVSAPNSPTVTSLSMSNTEDATSVDGSTPKAATTRESLPNTGEDSISDEVPSPGDPIGEKVSAISSPIAAGT